MRSKHAVLKTDAEGNLIGIPKLPPNIEVSAYFYLPDPPAVIENREQLKINFNRRFKEIAEADGVTNPNLWVWDIHLPPGEPLFLTWKSEDLLRILTLQENEPDSEEDEPESEEYDPEIEELERELKDRPPLQFGYFFDKSGRDFEYNYLYLSCIACDEKADEIFQIYKLWFIEETPLDEMKEIVEEYFQRLNN